MTASTVVYMLTLLCMASSAVGVLAHACAMAVSSRRLPWWWAGLVGDVIALAMTAYVVAVPFQQGACLAALAANASWMSYVLHRMRQHRVTAVRQQINEDAL